MYESPEVMEIGPAEKLTLGKPNTTDIENCECTRVADIVIVDG